MDIMDFATAERRAADESKDRLFATRICGLLKNSFFCCGIDNADSTPPSSPAEWYDQEVLITPRPSPLSKDLMSTQHELALIKQEAWQRSPTSVCAPSSYAETPPPLERTMVRARPSEPSNHEPTGVQAALTFPAFLCSLSILPLPHSPTR